MQYLVSKNNHKIEVKKGNYRKIKIKTLPFSHTHTSEERREENGRKRGPTPEVAVFLRLSFGGVDHGL
uniref:Uncharacterized protein n=1 Tax=Salix viminalis TaxID=40686 RepID=A0A6N2N9B6_SALVM